MISFCCFFEDKKEPDAKIAKTEEETPDKEEEEKSTKPPAGSSKSGWKNWKKTKESDSGGEESKITYCHWLLKSEPESRLEKGVDVKVSTDTHPCSAKYRSGFTTVQSISA